MLLVLFRRQPRLIVTTDGITRIPTEAITTVIATKGITTSISTAGTTIGTGVGLSASVGVQDTIAIGKRIDGLGALAILSNRALPMRGTSGRFLTRRDRSAGIGLDLMNRPHHHARRIKGEI